MGIHCGSASSVAPIANMQVIQNIIDGVLSVRIDDDRSRHSRVMISFFTHGGKMLGHTFRGVATNRWVQFTLDANTKRFSGYVCAQGSDDTTKESNLACAADVVK